jgi:hypothetical protein
MARTWFSYVVFAMGLMLLFASDKSSIAETKSVVTRNVMQLDDAKDIQVFVNKNGDTNEMVDIIINGEKHSFSIPELLDGETKTLTTAEGKEVTVKAFEGGKMVFVGGEEIKLPKLHATSGLGKEGLSSIITRVHEISDFSKNSITINGNDLPEDAVKAMVDAVQGVLTSYGLEREVMYRTAPKFQFIEANGDAIELQGKHIQMHPSAHQFEIEIESTGALKTGNNVIFLKKNKETKEKQDQ